MSIENVGKFFELVKTNKNLTPEIAKIKNEVQNKGETVDYEQVIIKKIIPLAKKLGLDFNLEDFLSYTNTLAQQGELCDNDLLNVSGGMSGKQGLAMLGIMLTLTPIASGFMGGSAVAETGEQQGSSKPTSSYSMNVDNDIDTASTNNQGAKNEDNLMTRALGVHTLNTSSDDEETVAGKFNGDTKIDVENGSENSNFAKTSANLGTFNVSENKQNAFETAENKEETQAEAKVNVDIEKKADDTEDKTDSLEDKKSDVSTTENAAGNDVSTTAKQTTAASAAAKPAYLSTAAGSATKIATETIVGSDKKAATETTAGSDTKAATATNSVKLSLNTLKEAVKYIFGGNIDESKTPSTDTYGDGIEIIYGWDQDNKPFALNSDGVVFSYNNGTAGLTLQQKLSSDKILELNNAEIVAEEVAKVKAEAAAEESTKSEVEAESNTDEVATADDSASETVESSTAKEKYFYSASQFSSWEDNGDGTVTAVDKDGETHTFSRHNEIKDGSTQKEQLANLANTIHNLKENSLNSLWPEDRVDFEEDLGNFIRNHWNAKTGEFEVDGVPNDDSDLQIVANYCKDPKTNTELKVGFTDSDNLANTINRINSIEDLATGDRGYKPFMSAIEKVACSKEFNTESGMLVLPESAPNEDKKDLASVKDFFNNKISNYDKSELYFKLDENTSKEEVVANWLKTANKVQSVDYISTGKSNFIGDGRKIAASVKYSYENGKIYYAIPEIPQNEVDNFVKAFDLLLSKKVEHSFTNSNNPEELRDNVEETAEEADSNILNIQKESRVQFVKDLQKLRDLEKQNDNEEEMEEGYDSDEVTVPTERVAQRLEVLNNQTSEKELLDQVHTATDKDEKNNAVVNLIFKRRRERNNNASKAQGDQNATLSDTEEAQNSQNEARDHVDASNVATETAQSDQNVMSREAEESDVQENVNASNTAASAQSNQAKVDFISLGGFGSTLRNIMPAWLGGRSIEEQQLDHLINFIEENGISGREQVSAPTLMNYLAAINEIGPRVAVSRNEIEEREKIYYFNGEVQDSSHSAAFATILRDFENLSNNKLRTQNKNSN